jgi:hypothetical protein
MMQDMMQLPNQRNKGMEAKCLTLINFAPTLVPGSKETALRACAAQ